MADNQVSDEQLSQIMEAIAGVGTRIDEVNSKADATNARIEELTAESKNERAKSLVDSYVAQGTIPPASREDLITQATENYDLVAGVLSNLPEGSGTPPKGRVLKTSTDRVLGDGTTMTLVDQEVFGQLGMLNDKGEIDLTKVTFAPDKN